MSGTEITRTTKWTGGDLTVGVMRRLIEGADDTATIQVRYIEGDRPFDIGYYAVSVTTTERQEK